jgi:hypothetical protein
VIEASQSLTAFMFADVVNRHSWDELFDGGRTVDHGTEVLNSAHALCSPTWIAFDLISDSFFLMEQESGISVQYMAFKAPYPVTPRDVCVACMFSMSSKMPISRYFHIFLVITCSCPSCGDSQLVWFVAPTARYGWSPPRLITPTARPCVVACVLRSVTRRRSFSHCRLPRCNHLLRLRRVKSPGCWPLITKVC